MSNQLSLKKLFSLPEDVLNEQLDQNPEGMRVLKRLAIAYMADTANMLDDIGKKTLDSTVPLRLVEEFQKCGLDNKAPEKYDRVAEYYKILGHHSANRSFFLGGNPPNFFDLKDAKFKVNKLCYAGFSAVLSNNKALYFWQWPSLMNIIPSKLHSHPEECKFDTITREEIVEFWTSKMEKQDDGFPKCGSWGLDNLPLTSVNWKGVNGTFIGDDLTIISQFRGILTKNRGDDSPFNENDPVQKGSENCCYSVNVRNNTTGREFRAFLSDDPQPQHANDIQMFWDSPDGLYTKVNKRGNKDTVDMQNKLMLGAGEHLTLNESILMSPSFKSSIIRGILEELSLDIEDLKDALLFDLGMFTNPGRDPRYFTYLYKGKYFGIPRSSRTHAMTLYLTGDAEPRKVKPFDSDEITDMPEGKHFVDPQEILNHPELAMIPDHMTIFERSLFMIEELVARGLGDKEDYRLSNQFENFEEEVRKVKSELDAEHK